MSIKFKFLQEAYYDNPELSLEKSPLYELMSYLNFKYRKFYEFISEKEQILNTCILYQNQRKGKNTLSGFIIKKTPNCIF